MKKLVFTARQWRVKTEEIAEHQSVHSYESLAKMIFPTKRTKEIDKTPNYAGLISWNHVKLSEFQTGRVSRVGSLTLFVCGFAFKFK